MPAQELLGSQEHFKYSKSPLHFTDGGVTRDNDLVDIYHGHVLSESISNQREMEPLVANEKAISMNPAIDNIQSSGSRMSEETGTNNSIFTHNRTANSASIKNDEKKAERPNGQYYFSLFEVDSGSDDSLCGTSPTLDIPLLGNQQHRTYGSLYTKIFHNVRRIFVKVDWHNSAHEQIDDSIFQASSYKLLQESSHYSELPRPLRHVKKQTRKSSFLSILQIVFFFFLIETLFVLRFFSDGVESFQEHHKSSYYYASNSDWSSENFIVLLLGSIFTLVLYKCWKRWRAENINMTKMSFVIFLFIVSAVIVHF